MYKRQTRNGDTIVGGRLITRAVHEWSDDYGDDVINALAMATTADRGNVIASLAGDGVLIRGAREDINGVDFNLVPPNVPADRVAIQSQKMSNILENLTAIQFARQGALIVQNPSKPYRGLLPPDPNKNPDLAFDEVPELADVISVTRPEAERAIFNALQKVVDGQAQRIVILSLIHI